MNDINLLYVGVDAAAIAMVILLCIRLVSQTPNLRLMVLIIWVSVGVAINVITSRHDYGVLVDEQFRPRSRSVVPAFQFVT